MGKGKLYLVATPIGNLKDITLRALDVLRMVDVIACEDTRHSRILLDEYDIHSKLIAYHKFNEENSAEGILNLLSEGKNVAVISDAGMPVISDPGNVIVKRAIECGYEYTVIAGVNAGLSALVLSGFDASRFAFWGFLSENNKERRIQLQNIKNFNGTSILYSSKHNVNEDLRYLHEALGNRKVCICNEISKMYEKVLFCELENANLADAKGEYVLVVEKGLQENFCVSDEVLKAEVKKEVSAGNKKVEAVKIVAKKFGVNRNKVYDLVKGD